GWASRPSFLDGRDAHPTRKKGNYLIVEPNHILLQKAMTQIVSICRSRSHTFCNLLFDNNNQFWLIATYQKADFVGDRAVIT
ncbi:hypothetical protein QUA67_26660, partial [Microcoleus sp. M2_C5]